MYNAQTTKERIKLMCKLKKINMENMLSECALGVNAIRQINDTKGMASFSLAKIADYLGCSVDYLLGRDTAGSLTDKQKWLLDSYEKLSDEYRRLIDRKLEQYAAEDEEYRVFEEIKERKKKRMIESLSEEKNISAPSAKK